MKLKIYTDKGVYKYKFVPIFEGIKPINKDIARENLAILKRVCEKAGITFILFYGTLLGAVREHDFIDHDEDIDIVLYKDEMRKFENQLFRLRELGFEVARYERRGFMSIIRKGEYIDLYFYKQYPGNPDIYYCCQDMCKKEFIFDLMPYTFQNDTYLVPRNYLDYFEYYFGSNWRTPIQKFDFNMNKFELAKQYMVQYVKNLLPVSLIEKMQMRKDKPLHEKWLSKIHH